MPCEHMALPGGGDAIVCRRGKRAQRFICDVDDAPVPRGSRGWQMAWRDRIIDLCDHCLHRYESEPAFQAFADKAIAKHYAFSPAAMPGGSVG